MTRKPPLMYTRCQLILANAHLLLRFYLPSRSGHISPSVAIFLAQSFYHFVDFSICTSATVSAEPCSPSGEVPWSIAVVNRRVIALSRAMTRTVSVLNVWGFRMHARRFTGYQNANFVKISVSIPSALGLRFLKRSHPFFPAAPQRPPRPPVSPRPGVRMWSSRRWRVSRRATPFLSLSHLSMIIYNLARRHVTPSPSS